MKFLCAARTLGIETVAEGVETPEQLECVRALGCDLVQGYLLARPMPESEVDDWVARGSEAIASHAVAQVVPAATIPGDPAAPFGG